MKEREVFRKKRRRQKRLLVFLVMLFMAGCAAFLILKQNPDLIDTEEIEESIRDTVLNVPEEVQELRDREIPEGSTECYEFYFEQLNDQERKVYRELLDGISERKTEIYVSSSENEVISRAFRAIGLDHSELFWMHNHLDAFQTVYPVSDYGIFQMDYLYSDMEVAEIWEAVENAWVEVNRTFSEDAGTYEKVQAVYTYLIDEIEYVESEHDQNISGAFWKKECVCAGYTRAAQYLLNRMGIPCIFVSGDTIGENVSHSWNVVDIGGVYYYMDATNGDQNSFLEGNATELAEHKTILYDYLCPIPEEYESMFVADSNFFIPDCVENEKNFYVANQGIFDTCDWQRLYEYCCMRLDNGAAVVRFKFTNEEAFQKARMELEGGNAVREVAQYYLKLYNLQSVEYHIGFLEQFYTVYIMF